MKIIDIFKTASSNLMRNKGRTILTIVAIFIGAFTIAITSGINIGVNDYIDKQVNNVGGENQLFIQPKVQVNIGNSDDEATEYKEEKPEKIQTFTQKNLDEIKEVKGIKKATPFRFLSTDYIEAEGGKKFLLSAASPSDIQLDLKAGRQPSDKSGKYEITLAPEYVKSLGYSSAKKAVNQTVKIAVSSQVTKEQELIEVTIVGVRNKSLIQMGQSIVSQNLANKITEINETGMPENMKDTFSYISVEMDHGLSEKEITSLKERLDDKNYSANTVEDEIGMIRNVINAITGVLIMFGVIALLAASFGIINTLYMSVQDRTREIGLMKAMGMSSFKVFLTFSFEALLIGFWGALAGVLAAVGIGKIVNQVAHDSFLKMLDGFTLIQFNLSTSLIIIGIIMLIAFLAGTFPANRAARLDPINALRYE